MQVTRHSAHHCGMSQRRSNPAIVGIGCACGRLTRRLKSPDERTGPLGRSRCSVIGDHAVGRTKGSPAAGAGRCKLAASDTSTVKGYHDIAGDGGSRVLEQVAELRTRISDGLAGVRHLVAVGSGKGGVGKSTLHPAARRARCGRGGFGWRSWTQTSTVLRRPGWPASRARCSCQAVTGRAAEDHHRNRSLLDGLADPGVRGARVRECGARRVTDMARHARVRARSASCSARSSWGTLDSAAVRPSARCRAHRPVRRVPRAAHLVPARDHPFGCGAGCGRSLGGRPAKIPNRLLGYVENMSGYYCGDCRTVKPLFPVRRPVSRSPASGPCRSTPSWPALRPRHPSRAAADTPVAARSTMWRCSCWTASSPPLVIRQESYGQTSQPPLTLSVSYGSARSLGDEIPVRAVRQPDEARSTWLRPTVDRSSIVYACPECGYEIAMLTNPHETQVVPVARCADRSGDRRQRVGEQRRCGGGWRMPVLGDDVGLRAGRGRSVSRSR